MDVEDFKPTHNWTCASEGYCRDNGLPLNEAIPVDQVRRLGINMDHSIYCVRLSTGWSMVAVEYELEPIHETNA